MAAGASINGGGGAADGASKGADSDTAHHPHDDQAIQEVRAAGVHLGQGAALCADDGQQQQQQQQQRAFRGEGGRQAAGVRSARSSSSASFNTLPANNAQTTNTHQAKSSMWNMAAVREYVGADVLSLLSVPVFIVSVLSCAVCRGAPPLSCVFTLLVLFAAPRHTPRPRQQTTTPHHTPTHTAAHAACE